MDKQKALLVGLAVLTLGAVVPLAGSGTVSAGTGVYKTTFPKIAGFYIGGTHSYEDPAEQAKLAKHDLLVIQFWKSWYHGQSIRTTVQQLKALHPNMIIGQYTNVMEHSTNLAGGGAEPDVYNKLSGEQGPSGIGDWWARDNAGNWLSAYSGLAYTNITNFVTPDANGDRFPQWYAKWVNSSFFSPVPEFDLVYSDNALYKPKVDADWDRNGTNDSQNNATVQANWRAGMASYWAKMQQLQPGLYIMGNSQGDTSSNGALREPEYKNKIPGSFFEAAIGKSWSFETWTTWENMMGQYRQMIDNTTNPHLVVFNTFGSPTDYATMRYGLASALMEDGYYYYSTTTDYSDQSIAWFDEYDVNLGAAIDPPQRAPAQKGVYIRKFQNGLVLVNPKGNGQQFISIPNGYKHFLGTQDPTVNNGQPVGLVVTIGDREGMILVK